MSDPIELTPDTIDFVRSVMKAFDEEFWLAQLFAARKRNMRPMRLVLGTHPHQDKQSHQGFDGPLRGLFLSVGPERDPRSEG